MNKRVVRKLTKEIHFPVVQAVPSTLVTGVWPKFKKFLFYRREWKVFTDHVIWSPYKNEWIFLPRGFTYDGASVPKILHSFSDPSGTLLLGAGPHDIGYRYGGLIFFRPFDKGLEKGLNVEGELVYMDIDKSVLDFMFYDLSKRESSLGFLTSLAWLLVILFGKIAWVNERKKRNGINAVRFDFPSYHIKELEDDETIWSVEPCLY